MPKNIGRYGWTVPEGTDSPAAPEQFTELASDIAATMGAIDDKVRTPTVNFTPAWAGINLGNANPPVCWYRRVGTCIMVNLTANAAGTAPTTAFTGSVTATMPFKSTGSTSIGRAWWNSAGVPKLGICSINWDSSVLNIQAIRQTDLAIMSASSVWGTAAWAAYASLVVDIMYPVDP